MDTMVALALDQVILLDLDQVVLLDLDQAVLLDLDQVVLLDLGPMASILDQETTVVTIMEAMSQDQLGHLDHQTAEDQIVASTVDQDTAEVTATVALEILGSTMDSIVDQTVVLVMAMALDQVD